MSSLPDNTTALEELLELANTLPDAEGGADPVIEALSVTENGTYTAPDGVDGYSPVTVNVPVPDGYIQPSGTLAINENGEHDVTEYASVDVDVPIPDGYIVPSGELEVSENGTHDVTEYASVNVNVAAEVDTSSEDGLIARTLTGYSNKNATAIGEYAFYNFSKLTYIDLSSVGSIGAQAFYSCSGLVSLIIRNTAKVCTLANKNALTNTLIASKVVYIYVPSALVDSYKSATNWSAYADQIKAIEEWTDDGTLNGNIVTWDVINRLTSVATSNSSFVASPNLPYTATLTSKTENAIEGVAITMDGVDITADVYNAETGEIYIPQVTGDLMISAYALDASGYLYNWDFADGITDENGASLELSGATLSNALVTIADANDYVNIPYVLNNVSFTVEVDVVKHVRKSTSHGRMIMCTADCGFIYRSSNLWALYLGSWTNSSISDSTYLNGKTVKFCCTAAGSDKYTISVYADDELIVSSTTAYTMSSSTVFSIGSRGNQCAYELVISGLRVKEG